MMTRMNTSQQIKPGLGTKSPERQRHQPDNPQMRSQFTGSGQRGMTGSGPVYTGSGCGKKGY